MPGFGNCRISTQGEIRVLGKISRVGNKKLMKRGGCSCGDESQTDLNWCFTIPSFLILVSSVDRGIPSLAAAPYGPAIRPRLSANADSINFLCCSAPGRANTFPVSLKPGESAMSHDSSTVKVCPSHKIKALSITFCSSRILPGQSYA